MLYVFGLSVALFLLVLILLKKDKSRSDFILLAWIGVIVVHLILFFLHYRGTINRYPHLLGLSLPLPVLHGVLLYWYTIELINRRRLRIGTALMHLTPFLLLAILAIPFYRLSASEKIEVFRNQGMGFEWYIAIHNFVLLASGFGFSLAAILQIRRHRWRILDRLSNVDKKMLRWLEFLAAGLAVIWLLSAFFNDTVIFGAVSLFVLLMGFFGINQYPVFYSPSTHSEVPPAEGASENRQEKEAKYSRSRLEGDFAAGMMANLENVMNTQKPFMKPDLTLGDLAELIAVSPNDLSQVINTLGGKTFYHYINTYRIREFLRRAPLPENRKFTYLGLAYQCGFTSKTTFNKYFKLETGNTPSAHLARTQNDG